MIKRFILILSAFLVICLNAYPIKIDKNAGVVLKNGVNMRGKPSVKSKVIAKLNSMDMFITLGKTKNRYHDKTFRQTKKNGYYWFKVKTKKGKTGWLFGKYCAINIKSRFLGKLDPFSATTDQNMRKSYKQFISPLKKVNYTKKDIDGDEKKDIIWVAISNIKNAKNTIVKGMDAINASIVISNAKGQSFILDFFGFVYNIADAEYEYRKLNRMTIKELTGDRKLEFILETYSENNVADMGISNQMSISSFIKGKYVDIFFEECGGYIDYPGFTFSNTIMIKKKKITVKRFSNFPRGLQTNIVKNYQWNNKKQKFIKIGTVPSYAKSKVSNLRVREKPNLNSKILFNLKKDQKIKIKISLSDALVEEKVVVNGKKGFWITVQLEDGKKGWVFSYYLNFKDDLGVLFLESEGCVKFK